MERRIAAVFAADMVGFSRLIERDELGTLKRQKRHLQELIEPTITAKKGRIVKLTGDGLIAEFSSVVEAVQCAVSVQAEMAAREEDFPEDEKIQYRVAVHLGDVVFDDGDVYGDGVNVAARLEGLAAPGGVVVSGTAYDVLKANVDVAYKSLGEQQLKNIATPVRVYQVVEGVPIAPATRPPRRVPWVAAAVVVLAMLGGLIWWLQKPDFEPLDPGKLAFALPDKPSLAVLPFENLSDRSDDQYMADGFVDTLITELMSLQDLVVIAKNSSFSFRDKQVLNSTIAEQLGVRYLFEGSFQHQGDNLRINARLMDAVEGKQVWSKRYDREANEFIALQDDLIKDLVLEIGGRAGGGIFKAERERVGQIPNDELRAYELWEKATQAFLTFTSKGNEENRRFAEILIAQYPEHPRGYVALAWYHLAKAWVGDKYDHSEVIARCSELAEHAIGLAPNDYMPYMLRAQCSSRAGDTEAAKGWSRRAFELNPNDILVQRDFARFTLIPEGRYEEAAEIYERNLRLNPSQRATLNATLGELYIIMERYEEALEQLRIEAVQSTPTQARKATALYFTGRTEEAAKVIDGLKATSPEYSIETVVESFSWIPEEALERFAQALKASGLPEFTPADPEKFDYPLPEEPSIAVLPFDYFGPKAEEFGYLADGLSENVTANLAKIPQVLVIARNSAFVYKGQAVDVREVSRELGVRYVLEGSLHNSGDSLRITAQLIDAVEGNHIWAETYDVALPDYFVVLDEITLAILSQIYQDTVTGEKIQSVQTRDLKAFIEVTRGWGTMQTYTPDAIKEARQHFQSARELDPNYARAHGGIGFTHLMDFRLGYSKDSSESLRLADEALTKALELDPNDGVVVGDLGYLALFRGDRDEAYRLAMRANDLNPGDGSVSFRVAWILRNLGKSEEAVIYHRKTRRLQVHRQWAFLMDEYIAHIDAGNFREAEELTDEFIGSAPEIWRGAFMAYPAVVQWYLGNEKQAREWMARALELSPQMTIKHLGTFDIPYVDPAIPERRYEVWRALGLPEAPRVDPKEVLDPQPDKPSIAVLPFENLSGDPKQEYFADGITEDLITDMSKLSGLLVIARNSTFAYKSRSVPIDEIAKELGVRYVLEGSVRRSGDQVRINAKLIDARTKINLWAERYDGALANVFALQDEVTRKIVSALSVTLTPKEQESLNEAYEVNPEAYDLYLRGQSLVNAYSPQSSIEARDYLERAIALDPSFGRAYAGLALSYAADATFGWSSDPAIAQERAIQYARKALALNSSSPQIYITLAQVYGSQRNLDAGIEEVERAIALDPDFADAYVLLGMFLSFSGKPDEGIQSIRKAMELSPQHGYIYPYGLAVGYFVKGQYDEAIAILESVLDRNSNFQQGRLLYIAILGLLDRTDDAEWEAEEVLAALPNFSVAEEEKRVRYIRENDRERYVSGLRKAGLPE